MCVYVWAIAWLNEKRREKNWTRKKKRKINEFIWDNPICIYSRCVKLILHPFFFIWLFEIGLNGSSKDSYLLFSSRIFFCCCCSDCLCLVSRVCYHTISILSKAVNQQQHIISFIYGDRRKRSFHSSNSFSQMALFIFEFHSLHVCVCVFCSSCR